MNHRGSDGWALILPDALGRLPQGRFLVAPRTDYQPDGQKVSGKDESGRMRTDAVRSDALPRNGFRRETFPWNATTPMDIGE